MTDVPDSWQEFTVTWSIDLEGEDHADAARQALGIHRDPYSIATVFRVDSAEQSMLLDLDSKGDEVRVIESTPQTTPTEALIERIEAIRGGFDEDSFAYECCDRISHWLQELWRWETANTKTSNE